MRAPPGVLVPAILPVATAAHVLYNRFKKSEELDTFA